MLAFVFFMALSGRDWGPMYYAEKAIKKDAVAVTEDASAIAEFANMPQVMAKEGIKAGRWWNGAVVPFMTVAVILPMLYYSGLCRTGHNAGDDDWSGILNWGDDGIGFKEIIGNADPYAVLIQQATAVFFLMMVMYVIQGKEHTFAWGGSGPLLWPKECIEAACKQCGHVWEVFVILIFANAIGSVMKELNGKLYLQCALDFEVEWVPVMTFILCAINSLATGTSWGTMAIFMPISVPLVIDLARLKTADGTDDDTVTRLLITTIAAVLGGAIWGDHCSLISDTTILSAMACRINPWDHFKTQFPYAIFCGAGACGALIAQAAYGDDIEEMMGLEPSTAWWIILPAGMLGVPLASVMLTFIPFLGGPIPVYTPSKGIIGSGTSGVCTVICCKNSEGTIPDEESTKV
jgi:Na+/H+ antiporter NhaC